ncbi:uncharacterized protein LOC131658404 [Vicia villosa]|uniref:uncharacterized protein LOC131658404 n=1 Tax=Vicia villosa TaxID=3911 RepID=UPI00273CA7AC|nr:uncharacterized protein LOC131658404 [Vicia villosa]
MVYNGETMINEMPLKVCDNKYKVFFNRATTVTAVDVPDILGHQFNFKSFTDFLSGEFIPDRLYGIPSHFHVFSSFSYTTVFSDVIGAVQHVIRTQRLSISPFCNVFVGSHVNDFKLCMTLISTCICSGTEIDVTLFEANGKLNISNAWSGSKLLLNHDHPQVEEFKTKFLDVNQEQTTTQPFSLNSCSQGAIDDRAFSFTKDVLSIAEMTHLTEVLF